ncbi:Protein kri1 [Cyphellophora attinorum]|uniref:Protein kri1 n=1 Tax=Cyphellophora attinorum TaxID=1664694 RepID=A0A0N1H9N9_9EURO|nr:Protein kri1 [Phialophora attinorum]KPI44435.1 Protein kri1 [Phialophora attinorum]
MASKRLLESDSDSSESEGGAEIKVNQDYAKKFEYNKKREEKARLEDKFGKSTGKRKRDSESAESSSEESSSEDEDEGELATAAKDAEIMATIKAIRSKDPRIYDSKATFYSQTDDAEQNGDIKAKKEKPLHLRDYHRQNLLNGPSHAEEQVDAVMTYDQEQENLKQSVISEMHAAAEDSDVSEDGFLTAKDKPKRVTNEVELDVENADKDPETFLSNFMMSRAWAYPDTQRQLQPFESDDEEEDRKADEFEEAYNLRFEDPDKSNETLRSHARDTAAKYSVRRDETNPRQRKREAEKAAKEAEKQQVKEEKARLRKLRVDEVEEKIRKIKDAAGLHSKDLQPEDWQRFVDEDWDDDKWEEEMQKRFGDDYYADDDALVEEEGDDQAGRRKPKKPKFDDDLDIKDIIPDFEDDDERPEFSLSEEDIPAPKKSKKTKQDKKADAKRDRRIAELLVDDQLQLDLDHALPKSTKNKSAFRYRETSPKSFGLSATDILLADDSQLNQFAGLKKLAAFRDSERKRKDQKHLGKKARLRQWRKDVFGREEGIAVEDLVPSKNQITAGLDPEASDGEDDGVNIINGEKKKKKRRKSKKQKV